MSKGFYHLGIALRVDCTINLPKLVAMTGIPKILHLTQTVKTGMVSVHLCSLFFYFRIHWLKTRKLINKFNFKF